MDRPIPGEIVACLERLGEALAAWCEEGRDRTLAEHEAAVPARVRAACPGCGRKAAPWEAARARQVVTQCGAVALARPWYHCRRCRRGWSVVETTLGVPPRAQASAGLERWVLGAAANLP